MWFSVLVFPLVFSCIPATTARESVAVNPVQPESLLLTGKISSVKSQSFMVPKAGDAWRYQIQWMMPEGEIAIPGQTVIIFDKSQIDNQIEQLEASLLRVTAKEQSLSIDLKSGVLQAKFDLKQKRSERDKSLLDANVPADYIAAKEYAENQFKLMKANSELTKAEQALKEALDKQMASQAQQTIDRRRARLELQQALDGIERLTLKAEIKGPILYSSDPRSEKKYAVGDTVQIGRQVASLPSMEELEIVAWVSEVDVDKIEVGSQVNLRLDSQSDMSFIGQIKDIGRQAQKQTAWGNSNWFKVGINFERNIKVKIIPGMSVLVSSEVKP
ncbi:HlyD family efflux transporter periplasmic adaptor subunit [Shewanella sp. D64]|uniref:HlyD family secretion protein n=1 Tax=unclassified Shewanella TaxID=196818 RepID=UPI0022BA2834|nr:MULTISPECIES: HlyD family efflux transporter periplasmic adaptor subunit [unclassified Shewanella]MEC4725786.1 HlyD family efflux transporter periplasmic adaptor subunit [Shewanella sp. D64]MEC4737607.1 HlyD family efflux transporter periplasmic adaptor subunit [Shewanella sp. E94]WBJ93422.1 HlyD family efflux transporter periplasmic adaptor subunit [Shewanella sp. MTB7]